jgi:hypothetical protein
MSETRDLELGAALRSWVEARAGQPGVTLLGPLDAYGMDPTWILRIRTAFLDAEVILFDGPRVDVAAFRPTAADDGMYVGYPEDVTAARLTAMADELAAAGRGAALPAWLRPA